MKKKKISRAMIIRLVLVLVIITVISRINVISNSTLSQVVNSYYGQSTEKHYFNKYIEYTPIGVYIDENNIEMKAEGSAKFETDAFGNISKVEAMCGSSNLISRFGLNEVTDIFEVESKYRSTVHVTTDIKYIYTI